VTEFRPIGACEIFKNEVVVALICYGRRRPDQNKNGAELSQLHGVSHSLISFTIAGFAVTETVATKLWGN